MAPATEKNIVLAVMLILFACGVVCYGFFPAEQPEEPVRILFKNNAGNVLFTHSTHSGDFVSDCAECHHNLLDEETETYSCGECHIAGAGTDDDVPGRSDAFHKSCKGCHEDNDAGPVECNMCHAM